MTKKLNQKFYADLEKRLSTAVTEGDVGDIVEFSLGATDTSGDVARFDFSFEITIPVETAVNVFENYQAYDDGEYWEENNAETDLEVTGLTSETESAVIYVNFETGEVSFPGSKPAKFSEISNIEIIASEADLSMIDNDQVSEVSDWDEAYLEKTIVQPFKYHIDKDEMFEER